MRRNFNNALLKESGGLYQLNEMKNFDAIDVFYDSLANPSSQIRENIKYVCSLLADNPTTSEKLKVLENEFDTYVEKFTNPDRSTDPLPAPRLSLELQAIIVWAMEHYYKARKDILGK
jgi:hypothetical protein